MATFSRQAVCLPLWSAEISQVKRGVATSIPSGFFRYSHRMRSILVAVAIPVKGMTAANKKSNADLHSIFIFSVIYIFTLLQEISALTLQVRRRMQVYDRDYGRINYIHPIDGTSYNHPQVPKRAFHRHRHQWQSA